MNFKQFSIILFFTAPIWMLFGETLFLIMLRLSKFLLILNALGLTCRFLWQLVGTYGTRRNFWTTSPCSSSSSSLHSQSTTGRWRASNWGANSATCTTRAEQNSSPNSSSSLCSTYPHLPSFSPIGACWGPASEGDTPTTILRKMRWEDKLDNHLKCNLLMKQNTRTTITKTQLCL